MVTAEKDKMEQVVDKKLSLLHRPILYSKTSGWEPCTFCNCAGGFQLFSEEAGIEWLECVKCKGEGLIPRKLNHNVVN